MAREKLTEVELIATFAGAVADAGVKGRGVEVGMGDDAAVFRGPPGQDYVVTKDVLVEGRHFRREWFSGQDLGWRLAAVNLSDIAAMGAEPRLALVSLVVPDEVPARYVGEIEKGAISHLARYRASVVGGNVSSTDGNLICDMTLVGACARGQAWRRHAVAGDAIVVAGEIGAAAAGLGLLEKSAFKPRGKLVAAYKRPVPRLDVGKHLAGNAAVHGAIDVSDGFSTDLLHMCRASGVGCDVDLSAFPVSRALLAYCMSNTADVVRLMLRGGDDYALILAVAGAGAKRMCQAITRKFKIPCAVVGRFTDRKGVYRVTVEGRARKLTPSGWDHFAARS